MLVFAYRRGKEEEEGSYLRGDEILEVMVMFLY